MVISEPLRYLAVRLAELMDPYGHFSLSANARLDPAAALRDLAAVAMGFISNDGTRRETMQDALARTVGVIKRDRYLPAWFRAQRNAFIQDATRASQPPLTITTKTGIVKPQSDSQIKHYVKTETRALLRGSLQTLLRDLQDATGGYQPRLMGEIASAALAPASLTEPAWRKFDEDIADLAGVMLGQGRDGPRFALAIADAFAAAASDQAALDELGAVAVGAPRRYVALFVLHGANAVQGAASFNCAIAPRAGAHWPGIADAGHASHRQLRQHLLRYTDGHRACGVLIEADALDPEHARAQASTTAEQLLDQIAAEHRVQRFSLNPDVLVCDVAARTTVSLLRRPRGVRTARTLSRAPDPALRESLRYHALAQNETAPVVAVLHSWIALEALAFDAKVTQRKTGRTVFQGAGAFLPRHLNSVMRLAAARMLLTSTWHLARARAMGSSAQAEWQELERWLGAQPARSYVPLERWKEVLQATPSADPPAVLAPGSTTAADASAWLDLLAPDLGIFADRRVRLARWILGDGSILVNYVVAAGQRAEVHAGRMNWLRNKAVHNALAYTQSARQLSQAAYDISDSVYEVLPRWLPSRSMPWEAFRDIDRHAATVTTQWRRQVPAVVDTSTLVDEP